MYYAMRGWWLLAAGAFVVIAYTPPIPENHCTDNFVYRNDTKGMYGVITLFNVTKEIGAITLLDVQFLQRQPLTAVCGINFLENEEITQQHVLDGKPVQLKVQFPTENESPALLGIIVNRANTLCYTEDKPPGQHLIKMAFSFIRTNTSIEKINNIYNRGDVKGWGCTWSNYSSAQATLLSRPQLASSLNQIGAAQGKTTARPKYTGGCGQSAVTGFTPLIRGGYKVKHGELPWLAAIYKKILPSDIKYICSGTLVSTRTIVSAAHCFKLDRLQPPQVISFLGRHNLGHYNETDYKIREVAKIIIQDDYNQKTLPDADVALLYLQAPVEYTDYIRPACLWEGDSDVSLIMDTIGIVAGWGSVGVLGSDVSPTPKAAMARIAGENECLRSSAVFQNLTSRRTLCAGNRDDSGPCMGDSGGGLVINYAGRWTLRGIISTGLTNHAQCNLYEFVVYCDLAKHKRWLRTHLLP